MPSEAAAAFGALMLRRLHELARREKARYDINPNQTKKFLLIGTQNTWFEGAATQFISVILTPYSSYVRHGMVRKDAFTRPFQPVPGHSLLLGEDANPQKLVEAIIGRPVRTFDFVSAWVHARAVEQGLLNLASESARKVLTQNETGLTVLQVQLKLAELNGRYDLATDIRKALASAGSPSAPGASALASNAAQSPRPSARVRVGAPVIGVDIRHLGD